MKNNSQRLSAVSWALGYIEAHDTKKEYIDVITTLREIIFEMSETKEKR